MKSTVYTEDGSSNLLQNFGNHLSTTWCGNLENNKSKAQPFLF